MTESSSGVMATDANYRMLGLFLKEGGRLKILSELALLGRRGMKRKKG